MAANSSICSTPRASKNSNALRKPPTPCAIALDSQKSNSADRCRGRAGKKKNEESRRAGSRNPARRYTVCRKSHAASKHIINVELQPFEHVDRRICVSEIQRTSEEPDEIEDHVVPYGVKHADSMLGHVAPLIDLVVVQIG